MKRFLILIATLTVAASVSAQSGYVPSEENLLSRKEFSDARLGIFIHWGIYSMMSNGEWIQQKENIDYQEYAKLARGFYPALFDAKEWVRIFKDAGAGYVTFTSRHHDGFSMFKTAQSEYNIVDATPFGRDVIAELAEACREEGLRLHFYYSHLDWHRSDYWPRSEDPRTHSYNRPDGDENSWRHYEEFMNAQLTELLTKYGPIGCIWFDGVWDKVTGADWSRHYERVPEEWNIYEQYELIHRLQPGCLVANNHHYTPFAGEDIQVFERDVPGGNESGWNMGQEIAASYPLETCTTMNSSWGYDINDTQFKTCDEIVRLLVRTAGKNANLLMNIGPRPDGTLPDRCVEVLGELGEWMRKYGNESVKGTVGGFADEQPWGVQTRKGNTIYVHVIGESANITLPYPKARKVTTFEGEKVNFTKTKENISFEAVHNANCPDTIYKVEL